MTANEKKILYTLLKTASDNLCGYTSPAFSNEEPIFTDDVLPQPALQNEQLEKADTLTAIAQKIAQCTRCPLANTRTNTVPGIGVAHPDVVVIGEGPGHDEDMQGEPFVGAAGQLLDKMLSAIKLSRHANCYICNIVKCRPPQNRTPFPEEAAACESFLQAQLSFLQPKMILCVGSTAAKNLLKTANGVTKLRGQFYDWNGIPVAVTYHPSALLRDASLKSPAWKDLQFFRDRLLTLAPDYATRFMQNAGRQ
jgi:DNA polymerase